MPEPILEDALRQRFGQRVPMPDDRRLDARGHFQLAMHASCRDFDDTPLDPALVRYLCALALSSPTKSDLQQRDIVLVEDQDLREAITALLPNSPFVRRAPGLVVFLANGRRLGQICEWRGKPFPNDHFDLLFNALTDASLALAWFALAVEMAGMGGCPLSEIRNQPEEVARLLDLPEKVIPLAGFCFGWPAFRLGVTPRLPLDVTVHSNKFSEARLRERIGFYDGHRRSVLPYSSQRDSDKWGRDEDYGWSEDKARQYAVPRRQHFGESVRASGFNLE